MSLDIRRVFTNLLDNMEVLYCGYGIPINSVVLNKDISSYIVNKSHVILVSYNYYQTATNDHWKVCPLQEIYNWKEGTSSTNGKYYYSSTVYSFYRYSPNEGTTRERVDYFPSSLTFTTEVSSSYIGSMLVAAIPVTT